MSEQDPEKLRERALADAEFDHHRKSQVAMFQSVITFGTEALKAAALICGGSAAAILAFISQMADKRPAVAVALVSPLKLFGLGLLAAVLATGVSYLSQISFTRHGEEFSFHEDRPFVRETRKSIWWKRVGFTMQSFAIALVFLAYAFSLGGFYRSAAILEGMAAEGALRSTKTPVR